MVVLNPVQIPITVSLIENFILMEDTLAGDTEHPSRDTLHEETYLVLDV